MKTSEEIIKFNEQFGIITIFCDLGDILGYSENETIYLNENAEDLQKINSHELLHFFEDTEAFIRLKEKILKDNKEKIDLIREQYELRYAGLYSEYDIKNGIIDTEIVIDMLTDNYIIEFSDGLKVGEYLLGNIKKELDERRYLNLTIKNSVEQMNLSKWEKLFVINFYDGKKHVLPQKENRYEQIRKDIEEELERLYALAEDKEEFRINANSKEILREYESEIKALEQRGEDTSYLEENKDYCLKELANKFSGHLYEEYKHIVDFIRNTNYEPAFKVLMLNETLTKTYKLDKVEDKTNTIIKKRDMHNTITGHMVLNGTVLETIYNNINDYNNFALIYFAGLEIFNKSIARSSAIKLDGVETYGKGKWLKFEGKTSNEKEYLKNAERLATLVKDTPWCTKELASTQLAQGDFFVFVDNEDKPHIAVKMSGNKIDEVRGILNGDAQEIEDGYRDVALSFLENNKEIKNGKEWLEQEERNKRLIQYNKDIENGIFKVEHVGQMLEDLFEIDYKNHGHGENTNKTKLKNNLVKIKDKLVKYYNCSEEELYVDGIDFSCTDYTKCPYKIIIGNAYFSNSQLTDLGSLQIIGGNTYFRNSQVTDLGNLQTIGGDAYFGGSQVTNLGNLQTIGGNANFEGSQVTDLGNLRTIGGNANFRNSQIIDLGNLQTIGGDAYARNSKITDLGNLQTIGGYAYFGGTQVTNLGNLQTIGGDADFRNSQIIDLGNLQIIGGDALVRNSKITDLGNLQTIGGDAYFGGSQVTNLGNLQTIGGDTYFGCSQVTNLGNLQTIGKSANFSDSKITNLGNLQTIGGDAYFGCSQVTNLGNLQTIGGDAYFGGSQVTNLGNLQTIGGSANFSDSKITNLGNLQRIVGPVILRTYGYEPNFELEKLYYEQFENGVRKNIVDEESVSMAR